MGGNPKLRGRGKGEDDPHAIRLEGPIVNGQCWIEVGVANPLMNPGAFYAVKALIDTGATSSGISIELARKIGLTGRSRGKVSGSAGVHEVDVAPGLIGFPLPGGNVAHKVVALSILPTHVPLLFGMTEICAGYLVVDGPKGIWRWTLLKANVAGLPPPPGQSPSA